MNQVPTDRNLSLRERGFARHESGDLAAAERDYREVLQNSPDDLEVLSALGHLTLQNGRFAEATELLRTVIRRHETVPACIALGQALRGLGRCQEALAFFERAVDLSPDSFDALAGRADSLRELNRLSDALAAYDLVLQIRSDVAIVHRHRSLVLLQLNRLEEGLASADKAIALGTDAPDLLTIRGLCLAGLKRGAEALQSYERAIISQPDYVPAHVNRGVALRHLGRMAEALSSFDRVLSIDTDNFEALVNRGLALTQIGRPHDALADFDHAIRLQPEHALAHVNRAACLVSLERFEAALAAYDRAIELQPAYAEAHASRAAALAPLQRYHEILASCDRAIALQPALVDAHFNRGAALRELGRSDEAMASFRSAHLCQPDHVDTNFSVGCLLLSQGRFDIGWEFYEWRNAARTAAKRWGLAGPAWHGNESTISGKTLFVYADQGLGDTLQFCRYLRLAERQGARIDFSAQQSLHGLLAGLGANIRLLADGQSPASFDHHCPLASLPRAFKTTLATIPAEVPYLFALPERIAAWRKVISSDGFKIGVCWHGVESVSGATRSFPLRLLHKISQIPAVRLINLHRVADSAEVSAMPSGMQLQSLGPTYDAGPQAFLDAAAVISSVDLVITCDTSLAHLAGALGRPTWIVLKYVPDWRWMMEREDSPWYPTVRLFRQPRIGDWEAVFERIYAILAGMPLPIRRP